MWRLREVASPTRNRTQWRSGTVHGWGGVAVGSWREHLVTDTGGGSGVRAQRARVEGERALAGLGWGCHEIRVLSGEQTPRQMPGASKVGSLLIADYLGVLRKC